VNAVQTLYYSLKEKVFSGSRPYDSTPLEEILRKEFGEETTMSDIKGLKVMVTTTLADRLPPDLHLFRNYESPMNVIGLPESSHFNSPLSPDQQKIWLAARSSGAAPTYFSSMDQYVDGGLIANNPTLDTLTEIEEWNIAVRSKGRDSEVFTPTVIVSLGCGKAPLSKVDNVDVVVPSILDMRKGLQAVYNIFNLLVDSACPSQGRVVDRARAWCSALNVPLFRLNPQLSSDINLDESNDEKLLRTMWEARAEMQRNSKMVEHLKYLLLPPNAENVQIPTSCISPPDVQSTSSLATSTDAPSDGSTPTRSSTVIKHTKQLKEGSRSASVGWTMGENSTSSSVTDDIKSETSDKYFSSESVTDAVTKEDKSKLSAKQSSDGACPLIPQLSVPNLSELLARSGVDPTSLASSMPDALNSLSHKTRNPTDCVDGVKSLPPISTPSPESKSPRSDEKKSSCTVQVPYPISDPPGYPYVINDKNVESFQPINQFNSMVNSDIGLLSDDKLSGSLGIGFCPDSPASIRSLKLNDEKSANENNIQKTPEMTESQTESSVLVESPEESEESSQKPEEFDESSQKPEEEGLPSYKWAVENA